MAEPGGDTLLLDDFEAYSDGDAVDHEVIVDWWPEDGIERARYSFSKLLRRIGAVGIVPKKSIEDLEPSNYG